MDILAQATEAIAARPHEPDWWTPADLYVLEARQYARHAGIDRAVAISLLRESRPSFAHHDAFLRPTRKLVRSPEQTVPGMRAAGERLHRAIADGETIAVFADYDPDGTTGAEALRLAVEPYLSVPCPGCNGHKGVDCFRCVGRGTVFERDRWVAGYADAQRGFGLTNDFVTQAHEAGATLLVTVDCGSTQTAQIAYAQRLGMEVIVVDHHDVDPDNPAEHYLNPKRFSPHTSENTGAQLAWKLGAATQIAASGRTRTEHWQRAMYLAGFGAHADMGPVNDPENRAFYWVPLDDDTADPIPPGLRRLAERLGEDPRTPGGGRLTSAALNLPKRTSRVSAQLTSEILSAPSEALAHDAVERLVEAYEQARPVRVAMVQAATAQMEEADEQAQHAAAQAKADLAAAEHAAAEAARAAGDDPTLEEAARAATAAVEAARAAHEHAARAAALRARVGVAILSDQPEYAGYSGAVASAASRATDRPTIVFASRGTDEFGQQVYKFSMRNEARGVPHQVGELLDDGAMRAACTLEARDESGEVVRATSLGGHPQVISGGCTAERIPDVIAAVDGWAQDRAESRQGWQVARKPRGAEAYLQERDLPPARFVAAEEDARRLAPFSWKDRHMAPRVSVRGVLVERPVLDEESGLYRARLRIGEGVEREALIPAARVDEVPEREAEWVVSLDGNGPLYLSIWHERS